MMDVMSGSSGTLSDASMGASIGIVRGNVVRSDDVSGWGLRGGRPSGRSSVTSRRRCQQLLLFLRPSGMVVEQNVAPVVSALVRSAPVRSVQTKLTFLRLAPLRLAPFSWAPDASALVRSAPLRFVLFRLVAPQIGPAQVGLAEVGPAEPEPH